MSDPVSTVTLELPEEIRRVIQERVDLTGRDFSSIAGEMLTEAVKMERVPGIIFADGPTGRRARVAGTGLDVWEIISGYRSVDESWDRLRTAYHWLDESQLRSALAYYEAYPDEIDARLTREGELTPEYIWAEHPSVKPRNR